MSTFERLRQTAIRLILVTLVGMLIEPVRADSLDVHIRAIQRVARNQTNPNFKYGIAACNAITKLGERAQNAEAALLEAVTCKGVKRPGLFDPGRYADRTDDWRGHLEFRKAAAVALSKIGGDGETIALGLSDCLESLLDDFWNGHVGKSTSIDDPIDEIFATHPEYATSYKALYHEILNCLSSYGPKAAESLPVLAELAQLPVLRKLPEAWDLELSSSFLPFDLRAAVVAIETMGNIATLEDEDAVQTLEELATYSDDKRIKSAAKDALSKVRQR